MPVITCFGETLWDVFPAHEKIGGAPLNVAMRLHSLGAKVNMISRIGKDRYGTELKEFVAHKGMDTSRIQLDPELPTGRVLVAIDAKGSASYNIEQPVAWDRIEFLEADRLAVLASDALIFGSLACREPVSRSTLLSLIPSAKIKVFDVNLRPPHYEMEQILELMKKSDLIKLNDEELEVVFRFLGKRLEELPAGMSELSALTGVKMICVTRGADGALLLLNGTIYTNSGYKVTVKDTVGAGDSFLATLTYQLLSNTPPQEALDMACAMGSIVASREGANPEISIQEIKQVLRKID